VTIHQELDWILAIGQWVLDGIDDRFDFGNFNGFERTQPFSLMRWVVSSTAGTQRELVTKFDTVGGAGYRIFISPTNKATFYLADALPSGDLQIETTAAISSGPVHLVATYSGNSLASGVNLYVNGIAVAKTTVGGSVGTPCAHTRKLPAGGC